MQSTRLSTTVALIKLGRPHFLAGGVLLHGLGAAIALYSGAPFNLSALLWGQLAITATQLMTQYSNEYFDLDADRVNPTPTNWSGGSRVLVNGAIPAWTALHIALFFAAVAFMATLVLSVAIVPGWYMFAVLSFAQLAAWFYSAPPLRLHSRGMGELTAVIAVTLFTPLTGYLLQRGTIDLLPIMAVVPLCGYQFAMLLAIEFPDAEGDRIAKKRTLVVRLGMRPASYLYTAVMWAVLAMLPLLAIAGLPFVAVGAVAALSPLTLWLLWRVHRGDWQRPDRWNAFGFYSIVLLIGTIAAELAAFVLLTGLR
jgi:1,4-dihydroxy-2-naphthoate octaprenyltransferase